MNRASTTKSISFFSQRLQRLLPAYDVLNPRHVQERNAEFRRQRFQGAAVG